MKIKYLLFSFLLIVLFSTELFAQSFCTSELPTIDPLESITLAPDEIILNNSTLVMSKYHFDALVNHPSTQIESANSGDQQIAATLVAKMNAPVAVGIVAERVDPGDEATASIAAIGQSLRIIVAINPSYSGATSVEFTESYVATLKITSLSNIQYEGGRIPLLAKLDAPLVLKTSGYATVSSNQAFQSIHGSCCGNPNGGAVECSPSVGGGGGPDCGGTTSCPLDEVVVNLDALPSYGGEYFPVEGACGPTYRTAGGRYAVGLRAFGGWEEPEKRVACERCEVSMCPVDWELGGSGPAVPGSPYVGCGSVGVAGAGSSGTLPVEDICKVAMAPSGMRRFLLVHWRKSLLIFKWRRRSTWYSRLRILRYYPRIL